MLLGRVFPQWVRFLSFSSEGVLLLVVSPKKIRSILRTLKESSVSRFVSLMDVWVVDLLSSYSLYRFQINYNLLSIERKERLIVRSFISSFAGISSVVSIFPSAGWLEREVWDMYGVFFRYHPDLRRILTDYGFEGFPLRKDFPLTGYSEVRYDDSEKRVVQEPLEITQEYRYFDFASPWENNRLVV